MTEYGDRSEMTEYGNKYDPKPLFALGDEVKARDPRGTLPGFQFDILYPDQVEWNDKARKWVYWTLDGLGFFEEELIIVNNEENPEEDNE